MILTKVMICTLILAIIYTFYLSIRNWRMYDFKIHLLYKDYEKYCNLVPDEYIYFSFKKLNTKNFCKPTHKNAIPLSILKVLKSIYM